MKKYTIEVCRISYAVREIQVEAETAEEAEETALDIAGNYSFSESAAEYEINCLAEIQ
jgi:hypothetical protein